jgi:hypothetical protein
MDQSLAAAVDEVLVHAEPVVDRLKHGGVKADLRDLHQMAICHVRASVN